MANIQRDYHPDPKGDWHTRVLTIWTEDDVDYEDKERGPAAFKRLTGNHYNRNNSLATHDDEGDVVMTLYNLGWVAAYTPEGCEIGVVIKDSLNLVPLCQELVEELDGVVMPASASAIVNAIWSRLKDK